MIYLVDKLEKVFAYEMYRIRGVIITENKKEAKAKLQLLYKDYTKYKLTLIKQL